MQDEICLCTLIKMQKYLMLDEKISELKDNSGLKYQLEQVGDDLIRRSSRNSFEGVSP